MRRGADPAAALEALLLLATADSLARLRDRYVRGEVAS
jgi:hypothetical protein